MTQISLLQLEDFLNNHPHDDIADIGGIGGVAVATTNYDGYEGFDICTTKLPRLHKTIICMDTFEHLIDPVRAAENIIESLENKGWLFLTTVFSWEKHNYPIDTYRYTDTALAMLFKGLDIQRVWLEAEDSHPEMLTRIRVSLIAQKKYLGNKL